MAGTRGTGKRRTALAVERARIRREVAVGREADAAPLDLHSDRMLARVMRAESTADVSSAPESRQLNDPFSTMGLYASGQVIEPPLRLELLLQLYEENSIHGACIDAVADDTVGRGWYLDHESDDKEVDEGTIGELRAWLDTVCVEFTWPELLWQAAQEHRTLGWSAWEIARNGEAIGAIFPLPGHTLRATKDKRVFAQVRGGHVVYFKQFGVKGSVDVKSGHFEDGPGGDANEVLIFRRYAARSPFYGWPKWLKAIPAIAEWTAIREYNVSWFSSGGQADKHHHVTAVDSDTAAQIADEILGQYDELRGRGHATLVTHGGENTKIETTMLTPTQGRRDTQFTAGREQIAKEILIGHGTPPERIGWAQTGALAGNAAKELLDSYYTGTIRPEQELFEARLATSIFDPELGGFDLGPHAFRFQDKTWDETELNLQIATTASESHLITKNEGRELIGFNRVEDERMDTFFESTLEAPDETIPQQEDDDELLVKDDGVGVLRELISAIRESGLAQAVKG